MSKKTDTKQRKAKNWLWRGFRRIRDRVWDTVEEPAEDLKDKVEDELAALLITAIAAGVFKNIGDALAWLREKVDDLEG